MTHLCAKQIQSCLETVGEIILFPSVKLQNGLEGLKMYFGVVTA